jgi:hypothetical protein
MTVNAAMTTQSWAALAPAPAGADAGVLVSLSRADCGPSSGVGGVGRVGDSVVVACGKRLAWQTSFVDLAESSTARFGLACTATRCVMPVLRDGGTLLEGAFTTWLPGPTPSTRTSASGFRGLSEPRSGTRSTASALPNGDIAIVWGLLMADGGVRAQLALSPADGGLEPRETIDLPAITSLGLACGALGCALGWDSSGTVAVRWFNTDLRSGSGIAMPSGLPATELSALQSVRGRVFLSVQNRTQAALFEVREGPSFVPVPLPSPRAVFLRVGAP